MAARCARTWCCTPPGGWVRPRDLNLAACGLECDDRGRLRGRQDDLSDQRAAHLRGRRRDRLPEPRLDLDGAGPDRRLPRVRSRCPGSAGVLPLRHLCGARDLDHRPDRGGAARAGHRLRIRHRPLSRDLARPHHGARDRLSEDAVRARRPPAAGRAHRRRGRHRADPHRPGRAEPAGHAWTTSSRTPSTIRPSRRPTRSPRSTPGTGCSPSEWSERCCGPLRDHDLHSRSTRYEDRTVGRRKRSRWPRPRRSARGSERRS